MQPSKNYTELNRDYAIFLPSISTFYNNTLSKYRRFGSEFIPDERIPREFEHGVMGTDFLNQSGDTYYNYKYVDDAFYIGISHHFNTPPPFSRT